MKVDRQLDSAAGMAAAVQARDVSAVELVRRALKRIEQLDSDVNSCVQVLADEALAAAAAEPSGPLAGVPVTVKESFGMEGEVSTWGCPALRGRPPAACNDPHVERLREAGAIVVARTNVPELACWGHTDNPIYGPTRNPHDLGRTAGGSSGGAAASVKLGIVPLALGSDAGGSIRIPASFCGVVGLKPSFATLPADAAARVSRLNCAGPLAGSVADAGLALRTLAPGVDLDAGFEWRRLRVGVSADLGFAPLAPVVRAGFATAAEALADGGLPLGEAEPPQLSPLPFIVPMLACEVYEAFAEVLERDDHGLSAQTITVAEAGATISGPEYVRLAGQRLRFEDAWRAFFEGWDVLLSPTTQVTAFEVGRWGPEAINGQAIDAEADGSWYPMSFVANVLGAPAISVPSGRAPNGLPLAIQLMGPPGSDAEILALAERVETTLEGNN